MEVIKAESTNWNIIDYGDAMGASPGYYVFSSGYFRMSKEDGEDDEEGGSMVNPGKGTIINQAFLTAQEMVQIGISGKEMIADRLENLLTSCTLISS